MGNLDIEIDTSQVERFATSFEPRVREATASETRAAMTESLSLLEQLVKGYTPVNFSVLCNSVAYELHGDPLGAYWGRVGSDVAYAEPVEFGTQPHWAPIEPLKLWAARVLGDERAAYAVRAAIARRGTFGYWMFARAFLAGKPRVESIWARVPGRIVARLERA